MYKYVLVHTSIFVNSGFLSYRPVRFWIRGGTRRYQAVPDSPVPLDMEVRGGTRPCTASYRLVPSYPGVRDFLVLPCTSLYRISLPGTASYRLVSRRGQGGMRENQNLRKCYVCTSTYLYILVHTTHVIHHSVCMSTNKYRQVPTCMYWLVLVCTSTYQYIPVQTSTYRYVLACTGMN